MNLMKVTLTDIDILAGTQTRESLDKEVVTEYAEVLKGGGALPPIDLVWDGEKFYPTDGFHRIQATKDAGLDTIQANVTNGTLEDAIWQAVAANQTHGLRRSRADIAKAIKIALVQPRAVGQPNRDIARHVGISHATVARYRQELVDAGIIKADEGPLVVRRGDQEYEHKRPEPGACGQLDHIEIDQTRNDSGQVVSPQDDMASNSEPDEAFPADVAPFADPPAEPVPPTVAAKPQRMSKQLDKMGHPVPEDKADLFANGSRVMAALRNEFCRVMMTIKNVIKGKQVGAHIDAPEIQAAQASIYQSLTKDLTEPWTVCPLCKGLGNSPSCVCRGTGWLTKALWNTLPENTRKLIEKHGG